MERTVPNPWRSTAADRLVLALAAMVLVIGAASSDERSGSTDARGLDAVAIVLLVLGAVIVLAAGRAPVLAAGSVLALTFAWYGIGYGSALVNVVTLAGFYRLGRSDAQRAKVVLVTVAVASTLTMMVAVGDEPWGDALTGAAYLVMAVLVGELVRGRQLLGAHYAAEAEQVQRDAERRVADERLRIARDVHDLLAHTVSSMTVQAGVAADAIDRDTEAVREALGNIRRSGREAMQEVRATVSMLRAGEEPPSRDPSPRLARLSELVAAARDQGLVVSLEIEPPASPLPELTELTAFRVVQESLTNVLRHSGATEASVSVRADVNVLRVEVSDNGTASGDASPGFGLRGMAERVKLVGGDLWHGTDSDGGWTVRAQLPLPAPV